MMKYTESDIDFYPIWTNGTDAAIYILVHGSDVYRVVLFTIKDGTYHPTPPPVYKSAPWILELVDRCGMYPTTKQLRLEAVDAPIIEG